MSNVKTTAYWTIQIGLWTLLNSALLIGYWLGGNGLKLSFWQASLDFLIYALLCIAFSHLSKILINKYCEIDNLKWIDIFKIFGIVISSCIILFSCYTTYIQLTYRYIYNRVDVFEHASQGLTFQIIFFLNTVFYLTIWTILYIAIKGLIELNKSRQNRIQLESNLKESQLNTLKGQINPHFMFNNLNNIRGLILEDADRSREMLTRLSEMLRYSLTKNATNAIPLEEELEMIDNFISISKIQLEDRLTYSQKIASSLKKRLIPPMIIQLLIENAIKHGISKLKDGGTILLEVEQDNDGFIIRVTNSGSFSFDKKSSKLGLGLENIKQRLHLLYGDNASFSIMERNKQVIAEIKLP